jgi:hypothetical protein
MNEPTLAPPPPAPDAALTPAAGVALRTEQVLEAENFIETYKIVAEWIRFADAKAAVTLTVNGVLLGLLIPTLKTYLTDTTPHPTTWWTGLVVGLFVVWLVLLVLSAASSFLCILPLRGTARSLTLSRAAHFHPAAVSQQYPLEDPSRFVDDCEKMGTAGLKREVLAALLIDSHLSSAKYGYVARAIQCLAASVAFGFFYLVAVQF